MSTPSSNDNGRARRVLVTLVITTAAAAVTAGVALQKHPHAEAVVQAAEASPGLVGGIAATAAPVVTRRQQWRDPWQRPAPLSESASTSIHDSPDLATLLADPSLPAAAEALRGAPVTIGEATPTF